MKLSSGRQLVVLTGLLASALSHAQTTASSPPTPSTRPSQSSEGALGTLSGEIVYPDGTPVPSAALTLTPLAGPELHAVADADGVFLFLAVPAGTFTLDVSADQLQPVSITGAMPTTGALDLPPITLHLATVVTQVTAISQEQEAAQEVREEEHQRLLGVLPNFFIAYGANAVPLSAKQKYQLSFRTLIDPATIAVSAIIAGVDEASGSYAGFGTGAPGYFKRFGALYGDGATGTMLGGAVLPSLLHQDPRYFYKGSGSVRSRIGHVLRQAVEQKGDNGRWQFAWSNTLGGVGSALISNTYYPNQNDKWVTLTAENFAFGIAGQAVGNFLQEFVFNHVTTRPQRPPLGASGPNAISPPGRPTELPSAPISGPTW